MKKAVFIERDGVLNKVQLGVGDIQAGPTTVAEFKVKPEIEPALQRLKKAGFVLIVTTNQPGLSLGTQNRRELDRMHNLIRRAFPIDDILVCPHDETDHCPCRKPRPGLLVEAAFKWHLNLDHSFIISDKWQDAEAASTVGCASLLLKSPWAGEVHRGLIVADIDVAVEKILESLAKMLGSLG